MDRFFKDDTFCKDKESPQIRKSNDISKILQIIRNASVEESCATYQNNAHSKQEGFISS